MWFIPPWRTNLLIILLLFLLKVSLVISTNIPIYIQKYALSCVTDPYACISFSTIGFIPSNVSLKRVFQMTIATTLRPVSVAIPNTNSLVGAEFVLDYSTNPEIEYQVYLDGGVYGTIVSPSDASVFPISQYSTYNVDQDNKLANFTLIWKDADVESVCARPMLITVTINDGSTSCVNASDISSNCRSGANEKQQITNTFCVHNSGRNGSGGALAVNWDANVPYDQYEQDYTVVCTRNPYGLYYCFQ